MIVPNDGIIVIAKEQIQVSTVLAMPAGYEGPSRWVVCASGSDIYDVGDTIVPNIKHAGKATIDDKEYLFIEDKYIYAELE